MSAALSERVGTVVAYPPLCEMGEQQRRPPLWMRQERECRVSMPAGIHFAPSLARWRSRRSAAVSRSSSECAAKPTAQGTVMR
jgi:hypothetical protein